MVMVKIILACSKQPLAAFIETVVAGLDVELHRVNDGAALRSVIGQFNPDLLLVEAEFPSPEESQSLLADLRVDCPQMTILSLCEPLDETLSGEDGLPVLAENELLIPFTEADLLRRVEEISGLKLVAEGSAELLAAEIPPKPGDDLVGVGVLVENLVKDVPATEIVDELQLGSEKEPEEEDVEMEKLEAPVITTLELTEIVEEGLPLDELPEITRKSGGSDDSVEERVEPGAGSGAGEVQVEVDGGEDDFGLDLDDFGDDLDDLESSFEEMKPASEAMSESDSEVAGKSETEVTEPVVGDLDALLDDNDFAEVELPETPVNDDPVLAELKSAGLKPETEVLVAESGELDLSVTEKPEGDMPDDNVAEDELSDLGDLLDEVALAEDDAADELLAVEGEVDAEVPAGVDAVTGFVEMPRPEEVTAAVVPEFVNEPFEPVAPESADELPQVTKSSEVTQVGEPDDELPEDYLVDEELLADSSEAETPAVEPLTTEAPVAEPQVLAEPKMPDFSQQIEGMTQAWSRQLLQSTYTSMDKMIKAIGDLAPTIVEQVAREVIPPLAEKVIKAEIARLEATLEIDDGEED